MLHTLHNVEHVVTEFLGLAYEVHEEDTLLIIVFFVVDVEDVAVAELVAQIVYLALATL